MGVFYNPQQPMPIGQIGYESPQLSSPSVSRAAKTPAPKRDLEAELADARTKASKESKGDPVVYKEILSGLGYSKQANEDMETYAKSRTEELKAEEHMQRFTLDSLRLAADALRAGRGDLAQNILNRAEAATGSSEQYEELAYNPKTDEVSFRLNTGDKGKMGVQQLLEGAVDDNVRLQEANQNERFRIQLSRDQKLLSTDQLTSLALQKMDRIERGVAAGQKYEDILKVNPELTLSATEYDLIINKLNDPKSLISSAIESDPTGFKVFSQKDPADYLAKLMERNLTAQRSILKERLKGRAAEGAGGGIPKPGVSEKVSVSGSSSAKNTVRMRTPDGQELEIPVANKDKALARGLKVIE